MAGGILERASGATICEVERRAGVYYAEVVIGSRRAVSCLVPIRSDTQRTAIRDYPSFYPSKIWTQVLGRG